jgi:tetratricopeptide (TPR) repeat protein
MLESLAKLVQRSALIVLSLLTLAAVLGFIAVGHLVTRFNANQQSRGRKLYALGVADLSSGHAERALDEFRAALTCDRTNEQYQLNLGRALRDTGRLDEAESYLGSLWQRSPENGTINLALARVAARRGSIEDAIRYYHNAMYGVWDSDADANRRKARLELIDFLLQKSARVQAHAELVSLAAVLPPNVGLHLKTAQLFSEAQDDQGALAEYEKVLTLDHGNADALAGAGGVAYGAGQYRTAVHYLQEAVNVNDEDSNSRNLLASANLILQTDPFIWHISDAERNRRIVAAFRIAGDRLRSCAEQTGANVAVANGIVSSARPPIAELETRWLNTQKDLPHLSTPGETDLPDVVMDLVFQIELETEKDCGEPQGVDKALLQISGNREAADQ